MYPHHIRLQGLSLLSLSVLKHKARVRIMFLPLDRLPTAANES
jgi:hypothetical protein